MEATARKKLSLLAQFVLFFSILSAATCGRDSVHVLTLSQQGGLAAGRGAPNISCDAYVM